MDFLPIAHDWKDNFVMSYAFTTSVISSQKLIEQRINGQDTPIRTVKISNWECPARLRNRLKYLLNTIVDVAIFSEPLTIDPAHHTGSLLGATNIWFKEDLYTMFNLRYYADNVVLFDLLNNQAEIKAIENKYNYYMHFATPLLKSLQAENVVIYPTMAGVISDLDIKDITDDVAQVSFTVKEI